MKAVERGADVRQAVLVKNAMIKKKLLKVRIVDGDVDVDVYDAVFGSVDFYVLLLFRVLLIFYLFFMF